MTDEDRLDQLIALLTERALTESETKETQELLRESPEALDRYLDHCDVETWLTAAGDSLVDSGSKDVLSLKTDLPVHSRKSLWPKVVLATAAVVAFGFVFWVFDNSRTSESVEVANEKVLPAVSTEGQLESVELASTSGKRDPWKVINSTGSLKHPGLKDKAVPTTIKNRPIKFNRDVRPVLSETCFHCHGPDEHGRRADLRLDLHSGAIADLGGYKAIEPGNIENSEAWLRIISDDSDELMPPPESHLILTEQQKSILKRWIEEGAKYEGHWAYDAPVRPKTGKATEWGTNDIDALVLARLREEGMAPSEEADPRTLIRRLTFDLTGFPPQPKEVEGFLSDYRERGEAAWQDAITRLFASPHYGERMAVPWLDQSRYADTNGYSIDGGRDMWLWRDWVIHAYNENMPFDQFVIEQLGGDLLPGPTEAQLVATGFNRNHMITHEGGTIPEENLTNYAVDRVKTTSEVFLGLTMACAQCHDHKYDPISSKEYYEFFSFFNELSDRGLDGNAGVNAGPKTTAKTVIPGHELEEVRAELESLRSELNSSKEGFEEWLRAVQEEEGNRGKGFELLTLSNEDASSPNRPGPYEVRDDGSVFNSEPSKGLNAFSHVLKLPDVDRVDGVRVRFFPNAATGKLTPHDDAVPKITTVLVSADNQQAKQVDIYKQLKFAKATASSTGGENRPAGVLDERNLHWWQPSEGDREPHLTITFREPVIPAETPYLSVMVFYGRPQSLPHHWRIDGFSGDDTDSRFSRQLASVLAKPEGEWSDAGRELVLAAFREESESLEPVRIRIANLEERILVLTEPHPSMVMDTAPKPRDTFILDRGQYDAHLEKVSSNTPRMLPPLPESGHATRLDLAKWMVQPDHPLTARVAANRIWSLFYGTGIVATTADFGSQGEWPSNPELLDWLAVELVERGWDQQALIREIVSSATYRQNSAATAEQRETDPNNRLLGRGPRFRLSAEFIRDQALATSGLLVPRVGGPSVSPYQPAGLWKEVSHFGSTPATRQVFVQDRGEKLYRRSLYTLLKRTSPHPAMSAFDAPNREMCITERGITNTPLQALVTLNDPQFAEASRVFASNLLQETSGLDDRDRLQEAFTRVTGRPARDVEINTLDSFLSDERQRFQNNRSSAEAAVSIGEAPVEEDVDAIDHAVWTQVSSLLFNLSETLTRS